MDPDGQPKISDGPRLRLWQWASLRWQVKLEGGEGWQVVLSVAVSVPPLVACGVDDQHGDRKVVAPPKAANEVAIPPLSPLRLGRQPNKLQ
jgi:hypothetical protein